MNTIKNININELNLNEDINEKASFLLDNGFNVYFADAPIRWESDKKNKFLYFIYEKEGFFAYYQNSGSVIFPNHTSTQHKPNQNTGSGWQVFEANYITNEQLVKTWDKSKENIFTGKEQNFDKLAYDLHFWNVLKVEK